MRSRPLRLALAVSLGVAAIAGAVTAVAGFVLADIYRPSVAQPFNALPSIADAGAASDSWLAAQADAAWLGLVASVASVALGLAVLVRADLRRRAVVAVSGAVVSLAGTATVLATRPLVTWDQLAVFAVTVGTDLGGYWTPAFDDGIRFVLLDAVEVSQGDYAVAAVVHVAAPVVALAAAVVALWVVRGLSDRPSG